MRRVRGEGTETVKPEREKGLLLLYVLDPARAHKNEDGSWTRPRNLKNAPPILAFALSFPGSNSLIKIPYKVNNVGWESEYSNLPDYIINNVAWEDMNAPIQQ